MSLKKQLDAVCWLFGFDRAVARTVHILSVVIVAEVVSETTGSPCDSHREARYFDVISLSGSQLVPHSITLSGKYQAF